MPESSSLIIQRLTPRNIRDAGTLFFAVYGRKLPRKLLEKKYDTSHTGVSHLGFIAYAGNRMPVAFYAVLPVFISNGEHAVLGAQSVDGMTHPGYRNKGLFLALIAKTMELCKDSGIRFHFGFPNQHSLPAFEKLQWEIPVRMNRFETVVKRNITANSIRRLLPGRWRMLYIKKQLGMQGELLGAADVCLQHAAGVYRNEAYMLYKTCSSTWLLRTEDGIAWFKISDVLIVGDVSVMEEKFASMFERLKAIAYSLGLSKVIFHCTPASPLHALFARFCETGESFPVICKTDTGWDLQKFVFTFADIDTF